MHLFTCAQHLAARLVDAGVSLCLDSPDDDITAPIATTTHTIAARSCQRGHSPTISGALRVPISGTAITLMALVAGGSARARPNQITCAAP